MPDGFTVIVSGTGVVTEIPYSSSRMIANVTLTFTWSGTVSDSATKDGTDLAVQGRQLSIPVTLTARQNL